MNTLFKSVFAGAALTLMSKHADRGRAVLPRTVDQVDIKAVSGKWYEIAHLPMYFQRKCMANITVQYSGINTGGYRGIE